MATSTISYDDISGDRHRTNVAEKAWRKYRSVIENKTRKEKNIVTKVAQQANENISDKQRRQHIVGISGEKEHRNHKQHISVINIARGKERQYHQKAWHHRHHSMRQNQRKRRLRSKENEKMVKSERRRRWRKQR